MNNLRIKTLMLNMLMLSGSMIMATSNQHQRFYCQKLNKENEKQFKSMATELTETDWRQLGFTNDSDSTQWNDPAILEQWTEHLIEWSREDQCNTIALGLTYDTNEVAGFTAYSRNDKDTTGFKGCDSWLWWMAISPKYRRQGCGRFLMDELKDNLQDYNHTGVAVNKDNDAAKEFYRAFGFADQGEWDDKMDWMRMQPRFQ